MVSLSPKNLGNLIHGDDRLMHLCFFLRREGLRVAIVFVLRK